MGGWGTWNLRKWKSVQVLLSTSHSVPHCERVCVYVCVCYRCRFSGAWLVALSRVRGPLARKGFAIFSATSESAHLGVASSAFRSIVPAGLCRHGAHLHQALSEAVF